MKTHKYLSITRNKGELNFDRGHALLDISVHLLLTDDMLVYRSNPKRVEPFSHVNTFVEFMLHIFRTEIWASEVKSAFQKQRWFWSKRRGTQRAAKLQLSVRTKSRTHFEKTCLQGF